MRSWRIRIKVNTLKKRVYQSSILAVSLVWVHTLIAQNVLQDVRPAAADLARFEVIEERNENGAASASPVIDSLWVEGDPIWPFLSQGDLWMNTWADDGNLYSGWGDGEGVERHGFWTDCGIARFAGSLPDIDAEERCFFAPTAQPVVNDKPSSLLFFGGRLYGQFHSPLGDPWIGYLAYSDDYGETWTRVGFYREGGVQTENASPWTRDKNSFFRCLFFINMGQNYELNTDGYVYGLGIGTEWAWLKGVRLARVKKEDILTYASYEYWTGETDGEPQWSSSESDALPLPELRTSDQGSAMFHPGIGRFLFLTSMNLFDSPQPWGPWTHAGQWTGRFASESWQGGYQPGIISKDTGPDFFWFTISGQNELSKITYRLNLGKMFMKIRETDVDDGSQDRPDLPAVFRLDQNFPNPFNPRTTIRFATVQDGMVTCEIYNPIGEKMATLVHQWMRRGDHDVVFHAEGFAAGIYFYKVQAGDCVQMKKCVFLK